MSRGAKRTAYFLLAIAAACLAWEGYTLLNAEPNDTISAVMAMAGEHWPLPVIGGICLLIGHWFWKVGKS